ncbi:MAG: MATE family efflux transporter [Cyclobacteriaceae bacterium]
MKSRGSRDIRTGVYSLIVKTLSMGIGFGLSIFLARELGAEGLGTINLVEKIYTILVSLCLIGSSSYIVKHASHLFSEKIFVKLSQLFVRVSLQVGVIASVVIIANIWILPLVITDKAIPSWIIHFYGILLLPRVYAQLLALFLRAFRKTILSNFLLELPSTYLRALGVGIFIFDDNLTTSEAFLGYSIAYALYFIFTIIVFINKSRIGELRVTYFQQKLFPEKEQFTFWGTNGLYVLNSNLDTIFVGYFLSVTEVAQYNVAWRLANLLMIFLNLANSIMGPKLATLFRKGELRRIEVYLGRSNYIFTFISIGYFLFFLLLGSDIVKIWGEDFYQINTYVLLLIVGQGVNIASAGVGLTLSMSNNEKISFRISLVGLGLTLTLYPFLLNSYHLIGAAIGSSLIVSFMNIFRAYFVWKKLGIKPYKWRQ